MEDVIGSILCMRLYRFQEISMELQKSDLLRNWSQLHARNVTKGNVTHTSRH